MNKIGQPPWSALQFPSAVHGASTGAGLAPAAAQVHPGPAAGRGPGPCLTLASRMRRTTAEQKPASQGTVWWPQWALATPSQKRGALVLCFHMRALEFGLAWGVVGPFQPLWKFVSSHADRSPQPLHLRGFRAPPVMPLLSA